MAKKVPAKVSLNHSGIENTPPPSILTFGGTNLKHYYMPNAGQENSILCIVNTGMYAGGTLLKLTSPPSSAYN